MDLICYCQTHCASCILSGPKMLYVSILPKESCFVQGSLPASWGQPGSMPLLEALYLSGSQLSGIHLCHRPMAQVDSSGGVNWVHGDLVINVSSYFKPAQHLLKVVLIWHIQAVSWLLRAPETLLPERKYLTHTCRLAWRVGYAWILAQPTPTWLLRQHMYYQLHFPR